MRSQWTGKNVDLALLSRYVENFFKGKGFKTNIDKLAREYKISVTSQRTWHMRENVDVRISGNPNDFVIELSDGKQARSAILFGYITTMIGGGSFLLRGLRLREALEKLEKEFWMYVEDAVARLVDSAGSSRECSE